MEKKQLEQLTEKDVMSVYSGKNGKCCCGCAGKHYYNPLLQKEAGKRRGYEVTENELNLSMVKKVLKIMKKAIMVEDLDDCFSTVIGERLYIVYLN